MSGGSNEIKETSESREAAKIALEQYDSYERVAKPFENKAIADVSSAASAQQTEDRAARQVNADTAKVLERQTKGMDPSRGAVRAAVESGDRAEIVARAQSDVTGLGEKQQAVGMQAAVNLGTDQANSAQLGFNQIAGDALRTNISDQVNDFNLNQSIVGAGATVAGGMARGLQKTPSGAGSLSANNRVMTAGNTANGPLWRP